MEVEVKLPSDYIPDSMPCGNLWRDLIREVQLDTLEWVKKVHASSPPSEHWELRQTFNAKIKEIKGE